MRRRAVGGCVPTRNSDDITRLDAGDNAPFSKKGERRTVYGPHWLLVALTVGLSLIGIVLWGSLAGSMLPLLMRRLGFDPATSSTPFVATLVDVTGLIIYFSIGIVVPRGTLL